jgi:hypothetical protein
MYKEKYLKYKTKYLDLKNQLGGGPTEEEAAVCELCPTEEEGVVCKPYPTEEEAAVCKPCHTKEYVISKLDNIILSLPPHLSGCLQYAFISDELQTIFERTYTTSFENCDIPRNPDYESFLKTNFNFFEHSEQIKIGKPNLRRIRLSYKDPKLNSISTVWHQDNDTVINRTFYNVIYYLTIDNCKLDCGTDIAYRKTDDTIQTITLPIYQGLIIAFKDSSFAHKSPIITVTDHDNPAHRLLIRTYVYNVNEVSDEVEKQNEDVYNIADQLNREKLDQCLKIYKNTTIDIAKRVDCIDFIKYFYTLESLRTSDSLFKDIFRDNNITRFNYTDDKINKEFRLE